MADAPRYERTTPVKPANAVQGFADVTAQFGAFAGAAAKMGGELAQESANKVAQIQGIEDAKRNAKEGKLRPMFPSITEADKHYANAYQQEQTQELAFQGQQMLQAFTKTAAKTPTGEALGDYEKFGRQGIEDIVAKAPRALQSNLRRGLEDIYLNGFNQLSNKVEEADKRYLQSRNTEQANQLDTNITNSTLEQGKEAGLEAVQRKLMFIQEAEDRYNATGGVEGYDPNTAAIAKRQAIERWQTAAHQAEWREAEQNGNGAEYLKDLRENPPAGLEATQQEAIIKGTAAYAGEYLAVKSAKQTIDFINYATLVDTGKMTEATMLQARQDVSEKQFAELEHRVAVRAYKMKDETDLYNLYKDSFGNSVAMASAKPDQLDKIFEKHVQVVMAQREADTGEPQTATLADRAMMAREIQATIPSFNKQLAAAIKSQNPQVAVAGANMLEALKGNQFATAGVSANDRAMARGITSRIARGVAEGQAVALAQERIAGLTEKGITDSKNKFKELLKTAGGGAYKDLNNVINQETFTAKQLGIDGKLPPGQATDFFDAARDYFVLNEGDMQEAFEYAKEEIGRTYSPYFGNSVDEKPEQMYLGPSLLTNLNPIEQQNSLANALSELFQKQAEDKNLQSRYEFDPKRIVSPSKANSRFSRVLSERSAAYVERTGTPAEKLTQSSYVGAIPGRRVDRDGSITEGHFRVVSDDNTRKPIGTEAASYSIKFVPKGKTMGSTIQDPRANYSAARWTIRKEEIEKHSTQLRQEQLNEYEAYKRPLPEPTSEILKFLDSSTINDYLGINDEL